MRQHWRKAWNSHSPSWIGPHYFEDNVIFLVRVLISLKDNMFISFYLSTKDCIAYIWFIWYWYMDYSQFLYSCKMVMRRDNMFSRLYYMFYLYICSIKVQDYVIFLYEGCIYTRYDYITCMQEVYVNLKIYIKSINFMHFKPMNVIM